MKYGIANVVEGHQFDMFFHHNVKNIYSSDKKALQKSAIYDLKYKLEDRENKGDRVAAARLTTIQSYVQFEKDIREVVRVIYKPSSRPQKRSSSTTRKKSRESTIID